MKYEFEIKNSRLFIAWQNVNADSYKILFKKDDTFYECANLTNELFTTISLLDFGKYFCKVLAIKDGEIIDYTKDISFENKDFATICFKTSNNKIKFLSSNVDEAQGYRLYKSNDNRNFNGEQNFKSNIFSIDYEEGKTYKVKPYIINGDERKILAASVSVGLKNNEFENLTLYKSFDNNMFLSWIYKGYADGFRVYQKNTNHPIYETNDGKCHFATIKNLTMDTQLYVEAFLNTLNGKVVIAKSEYVSLTNREYEKAEISLIIPAYNSQNYIARSIDSALASDFKNLEILVVNDGSTDATQDVIDWYSRNYANVISIPKENGGVADARNLGIKVARGKYIAFLDNDDLVRPQMFSTLYKSIVENSTDIAIAPLYRLIDSGYTKHCNLPFEQNKSINIDEYFKILYTPGFYNCAIWNKLYRADIVKAHPLGILKYEDVSWTPCILSWAKTFSFVKETMYEWDRKSRPETFGDVLAKMPQEDLFEHRKQAMMFFINNGNPEKLEQLKTIAIRRLNRYAKNSSHLGYQELINTLSK